MTIPSITQVLFYLACIYILYKFLSPVLLDFIAEKFLGTKLNQDHDIDELIRKKTQQLKHNQNTPYGGNRTSAGPIDKYQSILDSDKASLQEKESAKQILNLIKASQWGESKELSQLTQNISIKIKRNLMTNEVLKEVEKLISNYYHDDNNIMTIKDIKHSLQVIFIIQELATPSSHLLQLLSKKNRTIEQNIIFSTFLAAMLLTSKKDFREIIIENQKFLIGNLKFLPEKDICILRLLQRNDITADKLIQEIGKTSNQMKPLIQLSNSETIDLNLSLQIFGLPEVPSSFARIEEKFKESRKIYHPDKISKYNLPSQIEKIANNNYLMVQKAYDTISMNFKKSNN